MKVYGSKNPAMPLVIVSDEAGAVVLPDEYGELSQVDEVHSHLDREVDEKSEAKSAKVIVIGGTFVKPVQKRVEGRRNRCDDSVTETPADGQVEQASVIDNGSGMTRATKQPVAEGSAETPGVAKATAAYACWSDGNAGRYCCQFGGSVDSIACWHDRVHMD